MAESGYVLFYTNQCPFNAKDVPVLEETAKKNGIDFKPVRLSTREDSQPGKKLGTHRLLSQRMLCFMMGNMS